MAGALVFDCACQGAILSEQFSEFVDEMFAKLDVPLAGFQTYGEICMQEGSTWTKEL
jgi:methyl-accepting chemotaxis protein